MVVRWAGLDYHGPPTRSPSSRDARMAAPAMTVQDVAEYLNVDPKTVCRIVGRGKLPGFEESRTSRCRRPGVDEWTDDQKQSAARQEDGDP
ncbi:MAG: DNA-binding protein [Deltaproteobacteria bacterium]|nr:MAG: DNA-binding protein [Deltaproteobacteria bacterium]